MNRRVTGSIPARRRLGLWTIALAALVPAVAWGQSTPPADGATPLLPPTRQFPNPSIQSEPLAPPPGAASPSLTGPETPGQVAPAGPGNAPAAGAAPPVGAAPAPGTGLPPSGGQAPGTTQPVAVPQGAAGQGETQPLPGQQAPGEAAPPPNPWVPKHEAVVQVLDKPDAQSKTLTIKVGDSATYRSLTVTVQACMVRPPDMPENAAAFLVIADKHPNQPGFKGWMFSADPSVNMLQNPIYDVRVKGCTP